VSKQPFGVRAEDGRPARRRRRSAEERGDDAALEDRGRERERARVWIRGGQKRHREGGRSLFLGVPAPPFPSCFVSSFLFLFPFFVMERRQPTTSPGHLRPPPLACCPPSPSVHNPEKQTTSPPPPPPAHTVKNNSPSSCRACRLSERDGAPARRNSKQRPGTARRQQRSPERFVLRNHASATVHPPPFFRQKCTRRNRSQNVRGL